MINYPIITWLAMCLVAGAFVLVLIILNLLRGKRLSSIHQQDIYIGAITYISFYGTALMGEIHFSKPIFQVFLLMSLFGLLLEYMGNWIWYRVMGARLYRYYKLNILGFASWYMPPVWGGSALVFWGIYLIIQPSLNVSLIEILQVFSFYFLAGLLMIVGIMGLNDLLKHKIQKFKKFSLLKYLLFVFPLWGGIVGVGIHFQDPLFLVFIVVSSIVGVFFEGILGGIMIPLIYGERFWLYQRSEIFWKGTSKLMFLIWPIAAILAFVFFYGLDL